MLYIILDIVVMTVLPPKTRRLQINNFLIRQLYKDLY